MEWERIERWDYVVVAVATEYHKKFDIVELTDIKQALYKWFLEHPNKLDHWESIGEKDAKNLIYRSLRNEALDYCQRWKAKTIGYDVADVYYYNADLVEALLPAVLRGEFGVTHKLNLGKLSGTQAPSEGGNLMVMMLEVDSAYWKLSKEDRKIIFFRNAESLEFAEIANYMYLGTDSAARMRYKRSIKRLIDKVGGFRPYMDEDIDKPEQTEPEDHHE